MMPTYFSLRDLRRGLPKYFVSTIVDLGKLVVVGVLFLPAIFIFR